MKAGSSRMAYMGAAIAAVIAGLGFQARSFGIMPGGGARPAERAPVRRHTRRSNGRNPGPFSGPYRWQNPQRMAAVEMLTNWQRKRWAKAGYLGGPDTIRAYAKVWRRG